MNIKTFLVDLDGVVVDRPGYFSVRAESLYPEANHDAIKAFFTGGRYKGTTLGQESLEDALADVIKEWEVGKSVDEVLSEWFAGENIINEEVLSYISELRERGIQCVIATDHSTYRKNDVWEHVGMKAHFDDIVASADFGATKEEQEFYEKAMEYLGVTEPATVLFTDDDEENTKVAKGVGLQTVTFTGLDAVKDILD